MREPDQPIRGRGAQCRPTNPHLTVQTTADYEHLEGQFDEDDAFLAELSRPKTELIVDDAQTLVTQNQSPDVWFRYSANPYRGCEHGCAYCYARPTHEYLGFNAGVDFETRVLYKPRAAELFRKWLSRPGYQPEPVMFSGVTDCYQPAEKKLRLTRGCLEIAAECRQPIGIVTKNALVTRDLDLLSALAEHGAARVAVSVTTLDTSLARAMEPRTSAPPARLRAIGQLAAAGVPTRVMAAPIIPGLNDAELPAILRAARQAGAESAGYVLLRLPSTVREVFLDWAAKLQPTRRARVESFVRSTRAGRLYQARFGERMRGRGEYANQIERVFRVFARRLGYREPPPLSTVAFRPPAIDGTGQRRLF